MYRWNRDVGFAYFPGAASEVSEDGSVRYYQNWASWTHILREDATGTTTITCASVPCSPLDTTSQGSLLLLRQGGGDYLWDAQYGLRSLEGLLVEHGADVTGVTLSASAMSDDGRVIVGRATLPDGTGQAFKALLPRAAYE